jgi:hypothetical protein
MGMQRADFEPFAWWLAREAIGADLREHYAASHELPPQILAPIARLDDAIESDQFREESSPAAASLLRKLDAIEGNQLLRACRTRLRVPSRLQRSGSST